MDKSLERILEDVDSDKVTRKKVGPRQMHAMRICMWRNFLVVQMRERVTNRAQPWLNLVRDRL